MKGSEVELAERIVEVYTDSGKPTDEQLQVHCKDFEAKAFFLDGRNGELEEHINELGDFLESNNENKVKIVSLLSPIPNIYSICVLTTLSTLLSKLKKARTDIFEYILKQLEFEMLTMQIVRGSKITTYLADPFIKHNKRIIDFDNKLEVGTNIVLPFAQSLFNIMIRNMESLNAKMANECFKNMKYQNIDTKYIEKLPELESNWKDKINEIEQDKDYKFEDLEDKNKDEKPLHERARKVLFETEMIYHVLRVFQKYLNESEVNKKKRSKVKVILIVATPVAMVINEIRNLIPTNNFMILYYADPVHPDDPPEIMQNIPSYINLLSPYYNSGIVSYGVDEYYHIDMLIEFANRTFKVPSALEELITKDRKVYEDIKRGAMSSLKTALEIPKVEKRRAEVEEVLKTINEKYIKKQEKIIEIENDGFLLVHDATLDQLKLLL